MDKLLEGVTLQPIAFGFSDGYETAGGQVDPIRSKFGTIRQDPIRLSDKLGAIFDYAESHTQFSFRSLLEHQHSKTDTVVTFLACLELIKIGEIINQSRGTVWRY